MAWEHNELKKQSAAIAKLVAFVLLGVGLAVLVVPWLLPDPGEEKWRQGARANGWNEDEWVSLLHLTRLAQTNNRLDEAGWQEAARYLRHGVPRFRSTAIMAVRFAVAQDQARAEHLVVPMLADPEPTVRVTAIMALSRIAPENWAVHVSSLRADPEPEVRETIVATERELGVAVGGHGGSE